MRPIKQLLILTLAMLALAGLFSCGSVNPIYGCKKKDVRKSERFFYLSMSKCRAKAQDLAAKEFPFQLGDTVVQLIKGDTLFLHDTVDIPGQNGRDTLRITTTKIIRDTVVKTIPTRDRNQEDKLSRELAASRDSLSKLGNKLSEMQGKVSSMNKQLNYFYIGGIVVLLGLGLFFGARFRKSLTP